MSSDTLASRSALVFSERVLQSQSCTVVDVRRKHNRNRPKTSHHPPKETGLIPHRTMGYNSPLYWVRVTRFSQEGGKYGRLSIARRAGFSKRTAVNFDRRSGIDAEDRVAASRKPASL
jgi:hypothetical protein